MHAANNRPQPAASTRPRMVMVFASAFVAGAAAAVGVNGLLDVWRAQAKPVVESEPIFVALRSLQQGSPVTVWDVGLRNWPKAMLPADAIRAQDSFEGCVLRHPLREGQPLLSLQLVRPTGEAAAADGPGPFDHGGSATANQVASSLPNPPEADLWGPVEQASPPPRPESTTAPRQPTSSDVPPLAPVAGADSLPPVETAVTGSSAPIAAQPQAAPQPDAAADAGRPAPNEPTPADTAAPENPAVAEVEPPLVSVVVKPAVEPVPEPVPAATADAAPARDEEPRPRKGDGMVRYLVVPERIAREADTFFTAPPAPQEPALTMPPPVAETVAQSQPVAPQQVAPQQVAESRQPQPEEPRDVPGGLLPQPVPMLQPVAPLTALPTPSAAQPKTNVPQPRQPARRPVANRPQAAPTRQSQAPARQPAAPARRGSVDATRQGQQPAPAAKPSRFGAVLSTITSGFESLGGSRRPPARPSDYDEAIATDDPALLPAPTP